MCMFLGLDLGTSGLRALLVAENGQVQASAESSYEVSHPSAGWSEQDPADWIAACENCLAQLQSSHSDALAKLKGIAVAGHMHGATLLDAENRVLRPCMLWNDTRSHVQAAQLDGGDGVRELSGNIVFPGFTAPKVMWVKQNEPEIFSQLAKVLLPKDYLTLWLTGELVSDMSDAAGTSWLDVGARDWSTQLLKASGLKPEQMPRLVEGSAVAGVLRTELSTAWGLNSDVVVAGGAADNAAAACGVGAMAEGDGFVSLGTSGVLLAARGRYSPMPETAVHTFCHAVPDSWYQMGVSLAATDSLNWLARLVGQDAAALTSALGESIAQPTEIHFLPYLSGERTPHNDSRIRGAFIGLDISHEQEELTRAVLQGVCFALRDSLEALRATGASLERVLAIGGGSASSYWVELCATVLNLPLDLPKSGEFGAAMGAARLAQCAATGANPLDVMRKPEIDHTVCPRAELTQSYEAAYAKWRAVYPAIKDLT